MSQYGDSSVNVGTRSIYSLTSFPVDSFEQVFGLASNKAKCEGIWLDIDQDCYVPEAIFCISGLFMPIGTLIRSTLLVWPKAKLSIQLW